MDEQTFQEKMKNGEIEKLPVEEPKAEEGKEQKNPSVPVGGDASKLEDYVPFLEELRRGWTPPSTEYPENFLDYTQVGNHFSVTSPTNINWVAVNDLDEYLYKDKGVDYFDSDFLHRITTIAISGISNAWVWMLANVVDDELGIRDASEHAEAVYLEWQGASVVWLYLEEIDGGTMYRDYYGGELGGTYYLTITRHENQGTYGTLYCYIYGDEDRTFLLDVLSVELHTAKRDFRYIYAFNVRNSGGAATLTGSTRNLYL